MKRDFNIFINKDNEISLYKVFSFNNNDTYTGVEIEDYDGNTSIDINDLINNCKDIIPIFGDSHFGDELYIFNIGFLKNAIDINNTLAKEIEYE